MVGSLYRSRSYLILPTRLYIYINQIEWRIEHCFHIWAEDGQFSLSWLISKSFTLSCREWLSFPSATHLSEFLLALSKPLLFPWEIFWRESFFFSYACSELYSLITAESLHSLCIPIVSHNVSTNCHSASFFTPKLHCGPD